MGEKVRGGGGGINQFVKKVKSKTTVRTVQQKWHERARHEKFSHIPKMPLNFLCACV